MKYIFITGLILFNIFLHAQDIPSLVLNLEKGDKYLIEKEIHSLTEQNVYDQIQIIKKNDRFSYIYEVKDIISDSIYYIKIRYKKYRTTIQIQDEISIIDTDSSYDESNTLQNIYKKVLEQDLFIKMTKYGKVLGIDSLEKLHANFKKVIEFSDNDQSFSELFKYDQTADLTALFYYPKTTIKPKEIWKGKDQTSHGILTLYSTDYFIDSFNDDYYKVRKNALIKTDKTKAVSMNNIWLYYNLTGEMSGNVILNRNTLMVAESVETQRSEGTVSMKYNLNSEPALIWPIIIENKIIVKTTEIN